MASPPSRKEMKGAMLAIFLESDPERKKLRSREFTELLFSFAESLVPGKSKDEVSSFQMESVGLFTTYLFRKQKEKAGKGKKATVHIFQEIAEESDELFDEIEARAFQGAGESAEPPDDGMPPHT